MGLSNLIGEDNLYDSKVEAIEDAYEYIKNEQNNK